MFDLPNHPRWIDRLFARLHVRYGDAWPRKWDGIDMEAVKADWCASLETLYQRCPKALVYALDHLPADFPPNSDAFLRLALQYQSEQVAIAAPVSKPDQKIIAATIEKVVSAQRVDGGRECADNLRARLIRDGKLGYPQKAQLAALEAIGK
jgi:hypothetical protein